MTREEKLEKYLDHQYMYENGDPSYIHGIKVGVSWADENPKSPWISVEDRLPEIGTIILEAYTIVVELRGVRREEESINVARYDGAFIGDGKVVNMMGGTTCSTAHHWMEIPKIKEDKI